MKDFKPAESEQIRRMISGLYNMLFEECLEPEDIALSGLTNPDVEADIYLPEIGINIRQWRLWSMEKKLEVILHELAHVDDYEDNHRPSFWNRVGRMVLHTEKNRGQVERIMGADIQFDKVKKTVVESVHEEVIDRRMDTVRKRRKQLREMFGLSTGSKELDSTGDKSC